MTASPQTLPARPAWKALQAHHRKVQALHLRNLFAEDPKRGERMTAEAVGIFLDYSKNRITDETLKPTFRTSRPHYLGFSSPVSPGGLS